MFGDWIRLALETKGMSQAQLSRELTARLGRSIDRAAVNKMLKGTRAVAADELYEIANITGVPAPVLELPSERMVPIVGYVGAGSEMLLYEAGDGENGSAMAPDGATENTVAAVIRGTSLGELLDQWLVFYDQVHTPPTPDMIGQICVVGLADGRILIKKLMPGQLAGRYTLLANTEPPIYDAAVEWAAKVRQMSPR